MTEARRKVLERVSSGELSPEEALALLAQRPEPEGRGLPAEGPRTVLIKADLGAVTIVADPTVRDAVAVGAHDLRRTDDMIRITGAHDGGILSDGRLLPRRGRRHALRVRLNPDLALKVRLGAGSVHVDGMEAAVDVRVELGTATLERLSHPFDVKVESGSVSLQSLLTAGASSISCELGTVSVRLSPKSSVTVSATTEAGRVVLPGQGARPRIVFGSRAEATIGEGAATLDIRADAGSISVVMEQ